jgi:DNA repair photolyase
MRKPYNPKANLITIYTVNDQPTFLQCYNLSKTVRAPHPCLVDHLARPNPIARTSYRGFAGKKGVISTYQLKCTKDEITQTLLSANKEPDFREITDSININELTREEASLFSEVRPSERVPLDEKVDTHYNICCEHTDLGDLTEPFILAQRHDIAKFCIGHPAKVQDQTHYTLVDKISPDPSFSVIVPGQHAVVKDGKGKFERNCIIDIGFDFSTGCISNVTPDGTYDPTGKCSYCYAHQNGPCTLDTLFDIDPVWLKERIEQKIEERNLKDKRIYFRLGQTTETHIPQYLRKWPGFRDNLTLALKVLADLDHDFRCAMPTKTPEFDEELAELLKAAHVSMLTSIAYAELEKGMVKHGFTVDKRLEEALKFRKAGVNSNIYIVTDVTRGRESMQPEAKQAEAFAQEHNIPLQFLDVRVTRKADAPLITGDEWESLPQLKRNQSKAQPTLFDLANEEQPRWGQTGQSYLCANITHPDWLKLIDNNRGNTRLCSTHACEKKCGKCFMD